MQLLLWILIAFVGLTATFSGMLMIADKSGAVLGLTPELLAPTFFNDFLVPGILLILIGSINIGALFSALQKSRYRYNWSLAGGILICVWIVSEMIVLQSVHWLQFVYLSCGVLILLLSYQLKGKWAA